MAKALSLIVPAEVEAREFDAKLWLACVAAERGHQVIVGCRSRINRRLLFMPRSVYVAKGITPRSKRVFCILHNLGHQVVALDEEALLYFSPEVYRKRRTSKAALDEVDLLLAWGEDNRKLWENIPEYNRSTPISVVGNPRVDLLRPELRGYFESLAEKIRKRYGRFILINSNFGHVNAYFPNLSKLGPAGEPIQSNKLAEGFTQDIAEFRHAVFAEFLKMVPELSRRFPDHHIVLRPHPAENQETWRKALNNCSNVEVVGGGNVVPWLLAADVMIQNGCTTSVESYLLGRPSIYYRPVQSNQYELILARSVSYSADTMDSLCELVGSLAAISSQGGERPQPRTDSETIVDHYVSARHGPFAVDRLLGELEQRYGQGLDRRPTVKQKGAAMISIIYRQLRKWSVDHRPNHRNNIALVRSAFPYLPLTDVQCRLKRLQAASGRFHDIHIRQRSRNIFEVRKTDR